MIDQTRYVSKFFSDEKKPLIVANVGGFGLDHPIEQAAAETRYELFADSLSKLDLLDVELIPQNMAPFPWHFGGKDIKTCL